MLRINKDDFFNGKLGKTFNDLRKILEDCYQGNCSEVIECDSINTARFIMKFYWEHATDFLPDWWNKVLEIKMKNGVNTFYIWIDA